MNDDYAIVLKKSNYDSDNIYEKIRNIQCVEAYFHLRLFLKEYNKLHNKFLYAKLFFQIN